MTTDRPHAAAVREPAARLLGPWIAATVLAEALGFAAAMAIGRGTYALLGAQAFGPLAELALSLVVGAVEGACLGAGQWRVLRRRVPAVGASAWIAATASGGALAWMLGMAVGPRLEPPGSSAALAVLMIGSGLVLGGVLGGAQALALRARPRLARRWVPASAVGWALGLLFAYAGVAVLPGDGLGPAAIAVLALAGAAMAVLPALATGLALAAE